MKHKIGTDEKITLGRQAYTPVGLSAKLLEYVRIYASEYLEEAVTRAVISVPAYFDEMQRQATVRAGMEAGFQVERILNEPTAAALSYGLEHMEGESTIASSNHFLGDFVVQDIPIQKAGKERIGVEFSYNMHGMLDVNKQYRTIIRRAEKALKNPEIQYQPFFEEDLKESLYFLKKVLVTEDPEAAKEAEEELMDMLDEFE